MTRETRLLLITITISGLALLLLSSLRFPESPAIGTVPLERLAARATFNELARIVADLEQRISGSLVVLRVSAGVDTRPRMLADVLRADGSDEMFRHVPALRISETTVVAAVGPDARVVSLLEQPQGREEDSAELLAADPARQLAIVTVPAMEPANLRRVTLGELQAPTYVVMVEGTRAGLAFRPVFVGSNDRFVDPRWSTPLLAVSSIALTSPGALVFSLDGQFLGCAVVEDGMLAIASAADVFATVERLSLGQPDVMVDPGIAVQPLTPSLGEALGVASGLVVSQVAANGPAAGILLPADVITTVDDEPIGSANDFLVQLARRESGTDVKIAIVRRRQPLQLSLTLPREAAAVIEAIAGMDLEPRPGFGSEVTAVMGGSAADRAGLLAGDVIVRVGTVEEPSPEELRSLLEGAVPESYLVLGVRRDGRERILALASPTRADEPR